MRGRVILLGPQRPDPNLAAALAELPGDGPILTITAGWRYDEAEDDALRRVVGHAVERLPIYQWFEDLNGRARDVADAWRERQARLVELKRFHRIRLHAAIDALQQLMDETDKHAELVRPQIRWALDHLRDVDQHFLLQSDAIAAENPLWSKPWEHAEVAPYHAIARDQIRAAKAILIAGGHVAVLRNRMFFFGLDRLLRESHDRGVHLVAWSAGAMTLSERVVLFYDDPPDGPGHPELLDRGVGLVKDLVLFPHCRRRLRLEEQRRISLLGTRFTPGQCIGLESGAWVEQASDGRWVNRGTESSALRLSASGQVVPLELAGRRG